MIGRARSGTWSVVDFMIPPCRGSDASYAGAVTNAQRASFPCWNCHFFMNYGDISWHVGLARWCNLNIFWFHPENWGNDPIWRTYSSNGLKPPTSLGLVILKKSIDICLCSFRWMKPTLNSTFQWLLLRGSSLSRAYGLAKTAAKACKEWQLPCWKITTVCKSYPSEV